MTTDLFEAQKEKDKAMKNGEANAHDSFREAVTRAIGFLSVSGKTFNADDVWETIEKHFKIKGFSSDPRALGGVLKNLQNAGLIQTTGQWTPSRRRHGAPIMNWRYTGGL